MGSKNNSARNCVKSAKESAIYSASFFTERSSGGKEIAVIPGKEKKAWDTATKVEKFNDHDMESGFRGHGLVALASARGRMQEVAKKIGQIGGCKKSCGEKKCFSFVGGEIRLRLLEYFFLNFCLNFLRKRVKVSSSCVTHA